MPPVPTMDEEVRFIRNALGDLISKQHNDLPNTSIHRHRDEMAHRSPGKHRPKANYQVTTRTSNISPPRTNTNISPSRTRNISPTIQHTNPIQHNPPTTPNTKSTPDITALLNHIAQIESQARAGMSPKLNELSSTLHSLRVAVHESTVSNLNRCQDMAQKALVIQNENEKLQSELQTHLKDITSKNLIIEELKNKLRASEDKALILEGELKLNQKEYAKEKELIELWKFARVELGINEATVEDQKKSIQSIASSVRSSPKPAEPFKSLALYNENSMLRKHQRELEEELRVAVEGVKSSDRKMTELMNEVNKVRQQLKFAEDSRKEMEEKFSTLNSVHLSKLSDPSSLHNGTSHIQGFDNVQLKKLKFDGRQSPTSPSLDSCQSPNVVDSSNSSIRSSSPQDKPYRQTNYPLRENNQNHQINNAQLNENHNNPTLPSNITLPSTIINSNHNLPLEHRSEVMDWQKVRQKANANSDESKANISLSDQLGGPLGPSSKQVDM